MGDEVERIVEAWTAVRPDLPVAPMRLLSRVQRLSEVLDDRRRRAFAAHGLVPYEFDVLASLRRAGENAELTPGQLAEATHVTSGTMTNRLDRLAERRLIGRRSHPADGRQTLVRLAAAGRRRVDGALAELLEFENGLIAGLGARDQAATIRSLRRLLEAADG